jgi:hypothetical protein
MAARLEAVARGGGECGGEVEREFDARTSPLFLSPPEFLCLLLDESGHGSGHQ